MSDTISSSNNSSPSSSPTNAAPPSEDPRFKQTNKEALITLGCYAAYFLWWYVWAYGPGAQSPEEYTYIFGLPEWFFYSCIVGYPIISLILWIVVRLFFKDVPLDSSDTSNTNPCHSATPATIASPQIEKETEPSHVHNNH